MEKENNTNSATLKNKNLQLIFVVTLFAVMGVASLSPAFPKIVEHFQIDETKVGWLISSFTIPGFLLAPVTGILADRFGRKPIIVPSLFLFGIAGGLCTFAKDFETLVVLRVIQGIGASSLGALNITIIGDMFSGSQRSRAMGYNASVLSIGTATYPFVGGLLANLGWNYPFVITLLAIPAGLAIIWGLKNPEPKDKQALSTYWSNVWVIINQKKVWGLFIISILIFVILYGAYILYFPFLLKDRLNVGPWLIGIAMSCMSVSTAITSSQISKINRKISPVSLLVISFCLFFGAMTAFGFAHSWVSVFVTLLVYGAGMGLMIPTIQVMLVGFAPAKERAAFMSLNTMMLRGGQFLGPMVMAMFFGFAGIEGVFFAGAGVSLIMILVLILMVK